VASGPGTGTSWRMTWLAVMTAMRESGCPALGRPGYGGHLDGRTQFRTIRKLLRRCCRVSFVQHADGLRWQATSGSQGAERLAD
jgi:hypothetical protein